MIYWAVWSDRFLPSLEKEKGDRTQHNCKKAIA